MSIQRVKNSTKSGFLAIRLFYKIYSPTVDSSFSVGWLEYLAFYEIKQWTICDYRAGWVVALLGFVKDQGCGNTMPDLSDLVPFHSGQVENLYLQSNLLLRPPLLSVTLS